MDADPMPHAKRSFVACLRSQHRALALALLLLCFGPTQVLFADRIVMRNNIIIEGVIVEESDERVRIRKANSSSVLVLPISKIARIERAKELSPIEIEADKAFSRNDYVKARQLYLQAIDQVASEEAKARINKKIDECSEQITKGNESAVRLVFERARKVLERNDYSDMQPAMTLVNDLVEERLEGVSEEQIAAEKARLYFDKAMSELDKLDYVTARESLLKAIELDASPAIFYLRLGDMARMGAQGSKQEAIDYYRKGLERTGSEIATDDLAEYQFKVGRLLYESDRLSDAIDHLMEAANLAPKDYRQAVSLASDAYLKILSEGDDLLTEADKKIERLQNLIKLTPSSSQAIEMKELLASIHLKRNHFDQAIETLRSILTNDPRRLLVHHRIAACYMELYAEAKTDEKRLEYLGQAEMEFKEEIAINPTNYEVYCDLAQVYTDTFRFSEARDVLLTAVDLEPAKWRAYHQLMLVTKRLGDLASGEESKQAFYQEAMAFADEVIDRRGENQPEYYDAIMHKAIVMTERGQYDEAFGMLEMVQDAFADRDISDLSSLERSALSQAYLYAGVIYSDRDRQVHTAEGLYKKAIDVDEANASAYYQLGEVNRSLGVRESEESRKKDRFSAAEQAYLRAVELEPENPDYHLGPAFLYYRDMQESQKALKHFKAFKELGGVDPSIDDIISKIES